ncbi:MAG TPA: UDP-N-acetylglucosamine 2-epimerase (non-hydrolyzing), partial [Nitrospira sp.]|nr:UDP-N-acetylglucosamine 2-epimerase (non-hydrolyzing) [Nitrospira sp.]
MLFNRSEGQLDTGRMIEAIEASLLKERPEWLLVYGDTDSTLAGALAAVKLQIPVAHVEAGLRSFNRGMPEEINRVLTDHVARLLFVPTDTAVCNLLSEGIVGANVQNVGDVMFDAALYYGERAERISQIHRHLNLEVKGYVLATLHRQENVDSQTRLASILKGFAGAPMPVVLPLHPRTRRRLREFNLSVPVNVRIIDPVGYLDMVMLEKRAAVIATDSGGVQKEAYFHRVPCITLRDETEWVELVAAGVNKLVGADSDAISDAYMNLGEMAFSSCTSIYGDGDAATKIVSSLN